MSNPSLFAEGRIENPSYEVPLPLLWVLEFLCRFVPLTREPRRRVRGMQRMSPAWAAALGGLFLFVARVSALSGPGRIDICDGEARYLVARGLVDHGEPAIRDSDFWFSILPGRDGNRYSTYRLPQSLLGVPALLLADAVGPPSECRREFYFSQFGAFVGAALAVLYAVWFRRLGHSPAAAIGWALAGIFCTPNWYYSTSTYDDLLGSVFVVAAVALAWWGRQGRPLCRAALAGLALGIAVNSKQPLGIFVLPVLALLLTAVRPWRSRLVAAALMLSGLALGIAAYEAYEWYKFPPGSTDDHPRLLAVYLHAWPGNTPAGLFGMLLSPGAGAFWFCPPLVLCLAGFVLWRRRAPWFCAALAAAIAVLVVFVSTMTFFKGDIGWGPRYLTPVFAVLWLFAPTAALAWPRRLTVLLLSLGLLVQLLGLSVDPHRLYVSHRLPSSFYFGREWIYFHPAISHLVTRPREILEILKDDGEKTTAFSPGPLPTSAPPIPERMEAGPEAVRKYRFLSSLRPWWISQRWLPPADRPVALESTLVFLLLLAALGALLMGAGLWRAGAPGLEQEVVSR
jgi:hypothetical protein